MRLPLITNDPKTNALLLEYAKLRNHIDGLLAQLAETRRQVLSRTRGGRYENGFVFRVKKTQIEVRAYTRSAFYVIRSRRAK